MRGKVVKRIVTLFLTVVMCLTIIPVDCFAVSTSYTPSDSYKSGKYYQNLLSVKLTGNQAEDLVAVASHLRLFQNQETPELRRVQMVPITMFHPDTFRKKGI